MCRWIRYAFIYLLMYSLGTPAQETGNIQIQCEPGATVLLDGFFKGHTGAEVGGLIIENVPAGKHTLKLIKKDFESQLSEIIVVANELLFYKAEPFISRKDPADLHDTLLVTGSTEITGLKISRMINSGEYKFVGSRKCETCHASSRYGAQYRIWKNSKHANAYKILLGELARDRASQLGIVNPQENNYCLQCHSTSYVPETWEEGFDISEGVGCETCHGAGSEFSKMKIMQNRTWAIQSGLIHPTEETCRDCHRTDTPLHLGVFTTYQKEYLKIQHPVPDR